MRSAVVDLASQPIRNAAPDPRVTKWGTVAPVGPGPSNERWGTYTTYTLITGAIDGPAGITSYGRATITNATQIGLGFHIADNPEAGSPTNSARLIPITIGVPITVGFFVRSSIATAINGFSIKYRWANVPGVTGWTWTAAAVDSRRTLTDAAIWTWLTLTLIPPAGATHLGIAAQYSVAVAAGTTLDATGLAVVHGLPAPITYPGEGATPGWKWIGVVDRSESVGYPYTLESIAGQPLAVNLTPNTAVAYTAPPAMAGRTLYVVHDTTVPATATVLPYAGVGLNATPSNTGWNDTITYRHTVSARAETRGQTGNNAAIFVSGANSVETAGRHIGVSYAREGDLGFGSMYDSASDMFTVQPNPVGFPTGTQWLTLAGPHAAGASVGAWLFGSEHSLETRRRVMAWLARKYGAPIPIGY